VGNVFEKGPEKEGARKSEGNTRGRKTQAGITVIQHIDDHRDIHTPYHQGMRFSKHLQVLILEQLRLPLIMNLFKLHNSIIITKIQILRLHGLFKNILGDPIFFQ
jgi:hypothetical protein